MKKSEFRALIREEIKRVLAEAQLDTVNQKLKKKYINDYLSYIIDPYEYGNYDETPIEKIEAHAKKYGYVDTLITIEKHSDVVAARSKYKMGSQDDPLASKAPVKNLTKKGKMDKRDVERLKMKIKQHLNLNY